MGNRTIKTIVFFIRSLRDRREMMMTAVTALSLMVILLVGADAEACTITPIPAMRVHVGFPIDYTATTDGTCGDSVWETLAGPAEFSLDEPGGLFYWTPAAVGSPTITIAVFNVAKTTLLASTSFTPIVDDNAIMQPLWRDYLSQQTAVPILGRAHGSDFVSYILEAAPTSTPTVTTPIVGPVTTPVATTGSLGTWDISKIQDGERYTLTLRVQLTDGTESVLSDQVIIDRSARPGWPKRIGPITHSPVVADLGDGQKSVLVVTHFGELYRFNLAGSQVFRVVNNYATYSAPSVGMLGGSMAIVWANIVNLYAYRLDGTLVPGFPIAAPSGHEFRSVPTLADINGDGNLEILIGAMGADTSTPALVCAYLYTSATSSVSMMSNWPQTMNDWSMYASVSVGDLDGDGQPEIVAGNLDRVYAWHANGSLVSPGFPATLTRPITGTLSTGGGSPSASSQPVLADLDGDGKLEIIIGSNVLHSNGNVMSGWEGGCTGVGCIDDKADAINALSPAVARTPSDGLIVVLGSKVWSANGTLLRTLGPSVSAVGNSVVTAIGEVVAGIRDQSLPPGITAFGTTGNVLNHYPKSLYGSPGDESAPVVDDFDGLGLASVAVAITDPSYGGVVALYDTDWAYVEGKDWSMLGGNVQHTGLFGETDLVVSSVSGPSTCVAGSTIPVSLTVCNQGRVGTGAVTFIDAVYLSTDATITSTDIPMVYDYPNGLAAGECRAGNLNTTIPSSFAPGIYYIGAIADIANQIPEGFETNNTKTGNTINVQALLSVAKSGTGTGTVTSNPAGINCGATCSAPYDANTSVTLTAVADASSHVVSWSGCDSVNGNTCMVTMNASKTVTANFAINTYTVTPSAGANGSINPNTPQTVNYNATTSFTVTPNTGYHIASVTGCGGILSGGTYTTGPITADCAVTANFAINTYTLTVTKAGTGSGTVTSSPVGINCGTTCSATYNNGTSVTLTASKNTDSFFAGWSGVCSGTGTCTVAMNADKTATATFTQYITVTVPNGGESWSRGTTQTIKWTYAGNPGSYVKIELLKAGVVNSTITAKTSIGSSGTGSYNWRIPNNQATGSDYKIRITSTTTSSYTDTSNGNFTIK